MALIRFIKQVGTLPSTLTADTLYAVRAGTGFDLYVTDMTGAIAYKVNVPVPGGAVDNVQYKLDANTFGGASGVFIKDGQLLMPGVTTATANAAGSKVLARTIAGKQLLSLLAADGMWGQAALHHTSVIESSCIPVAEAGQRATFNRVGMFGNPQFNPSGNAYSVAVAGTGVLARIPRARIASSTGANRLAEMWLSAGATIGNGLGAGGFMYSSIFAISDATVVTAAAMFAGLSNVNGTLNTGLPATFTNCIGVGCDPGRANLKLYYGGSAAQTAIDLGANFPARMRGTDVYQVIIHASPRATSVNVEVVRLNTGNRFTQTLTAATAGTQLPAPTTILYPHVWRNTNTASSVVALEIGPVVMETFLS